MAGIAERTLGKRTVHYMKNEAMVGRITRHRIQTLASILGVSHQVQINLGVRRSEEGDDRYRYAILQYHKLIAGKCILDRAMGEVLDAWCTNKALRGVSFADLSSALEQARLSYHADTVRSMNGGEGEITVNCNLFPCWKYLEVHRSRLLL